MRNRILDGAVAALFALACASAPAGAAGFGIFEQGARAMGLAGAFTAQADDPSAMFHNVGGLAFLEERAGRAGVTYITFTTADFRGGSPFPGEGASAEQERLSEFVPHAYWAQPVNRDWKFGIAVESPFGLATEWKDAASFAGRFLSTRAALRAIDLNPSLAWRISPELGLGFGVVYRFSDVELERHLPFPNPLGAGVLDVGTVGLESGFEPGMGWSFGLLHRATGRVSWGFSYRSKVEVDYDGTARFTQRPTGIPPLDAAVAAAIPFGLDLDVSTSIEFPDMASLGVAFALSPDAKLELDANWTGWSTFDEVQLSFTGLPQLSSTIEEEWEDAMNYRAGFSWRRPSGCEWRFGYVFDETPQPDEHVSPLLPDADRNGLTAGWGRKFDETSLDLALMYLKFDERTTTVNADGFNGTYTTTAWLFGATFGF
jgi:long-chain fatty acid transport protein